MDTLIYKINKVMSIILGIGYKARHGKDYLATYLKNKLNNCFLLHWADSLKKEVMNKERTLPLIYTKEHKGNIYYNILNKNNNLIYYHVLQAQNVPILHNIFINRNITEYWGMDGNGDDEFKDGPMLQFWGTDYRRKMFDTNWWVNLTMQEASDIAEKYDKKDYPAIIIIPDTRFPNEVDAIRTKNGYYIKVNRINKDGTPYIDPSRDPQHPSENSLDGVTGDYEVTAVSGDLQTIHNFGDELIKILKLSSLVK